MSLLADGRRRLAVEARRLSLRLRSESRELDPAAARHALVGGGHALVLCYGNICRSPFAERTLRAELADRGVTDVTVSSAGFFETEGRSSPLEAVTVADEFGVDLADHRSRRVTRGMLRAADVVFVMDALNDHLLRRGFDARGCYLGSQAPDVGDVEIADPYGGDRDRFREAYAEVDAAVVELAAGLAD